MILAAHSISDYHPPPHRVPKILHPHRRLTLRPFYALLVLEVFYKDIVNDYSCITTVDAYFAWPFVFGTCALRLTGARRSPLCFSCAGSIGVRILKPISSSE